MNGFFRRAPLACLSIWLAGCTAGPRFNPHLPGPARAAHLETIALTNALEPAWLKPPETPFTLGPGDRVDIELLGDMATRTQATVGPDGRVYFHLLSGVDVWGLTLSETKARLEKDLGEFLRDQPSVGLTLRAVESKKVWLLGRLQQPGVYSMPAPMTVLEAIASAGGLVSSAANQESSSALTGEEVADLRRAFLVRQGRLVPVDFYRLIQMGDASQNIFLQPDDFIYIPSATTRQIYVLGAVLTPRGVPYTEHMSLVAAVANGGGTIEDAYIHHVAIVRGSLSEPRIAIVDYKEIVIGRAPDVPLEPNDIVYVPFSPYRYLRKYADLILDTFVSTMAINEGAAAAGGAGREGNVVIPVMIPPPPTRTIVVPQSGR